MKLALVSVAATVAILCVTVIGGSASAAPQPSVAGGGEQLQFGTLPPPFSFGISAHGTGPTATGSLTFTSPHGTGGQASHAEVTCLFVNGNDAIATGVFTQPESARGQLVVMEAIDNGEPGQASPDLLRFSFEPFIVPAGEEGCWLPVLAPVAIYSGNIVVRAG